MINIKTLIPTELMIHSYIYINQQHYVGIEGQQKECKQGRDDSIKLFLYPSYISFHIKDM